MDRQIIYPGQIPMETDLLNAQKNDMMALSKLAAGILGLTTVVNGLGCAPNSPAALNVVVSAGEIYSLQNVDGTAYSSLAADITHQILKQGILLDAVTPGTPAPATAGQSVVYLIQAGYTDSDLLPVVLPYYNASNPAIAYSGPANAGTTNNTVRKGVCTIVAKAGIAAATGSQVTPAPDSGYVGLFAVTVANGQTSVVAGNIAQLSTAPFTTTIPTLIASLQSSSSTVGATSGTSDAIIGTFSPAPTVAVNGAPLLVRAASANATTTPTFTSNSGVVAASIIVKGNNLPLAIGDIAGAGHWLELQWDSALTKWVLQNPANGIVAGVVKQIQPVAATVASSALTVTLNPTSLDFRSPTLSAGTVNTRAITAAISLVVPSGATLGTTAAIQSRLVLLAIDATSAGGSIELAVVNISGGTNLDETTLISTTAVSAAATSASVVYSATARTNLPFRVVGFLDNTQATAGTWATPPSTVQGVGGQALAAMSGLGNGQTRQNLTASRIAGTTYYNTTGKPIFVSAYGVSTGGAFNIWWTVAGVQGGNIGVSSNSGLYASITDVVAVGAPYVLTQTGATINGWVELR